jgi:hypothetical protein
LCKLISNLNTSYCQSKSKMPPNWSFQILFIGCMEVFYKKVKGKRGESLLGVFSLNNVKLKKRCAKQRCIVQWGQRWWWQFQILMNSKAIFCVLEGTKQWKIKNNSYIPKFVGSSIAFQQGFKKFLEFLVPSSQFEITKFHGRTLHKRVFSKI